MTSPAPNLELVIAQGKTFRKVFRRMSLPFVYVPIIAVTQGAPAVVECNQAHGVPDGWRVAIVSVKGMRQINAEEDPPGMDEYHRASVVDDTTLSLNRVNSALYSPYTSGGYVQFYTPLDLAGCTVRMTARDRVGGTVLLQADSESGGDFTLDNTAKTITLELSAAVTAAMTWTRGVYEVEFENAAGKVTTIARGSIVVNPKEITT